MYAGFALFELESGQSLWLDPELNFLKSYLEHWFFVVEK